MSDDLVAFLRARLTEDEEIARNATARQPGAEVWSYDQPAVRTQGSLTVIGRIVPVTGEHIARHDPARVLAEVEAKRELLKIHRPYADEPDQACLGCAGAIEFERCPVVRLLALPYADHPDYRPEWRT